MIDIKTLNQWSRDAGIAFDLEDGSDCVAAWTEAFLDDEQLMKDVWSELIIGTPAEDEILHRLKVRRTCSSSAVAKSRNNAMLGNKLHFAVTRRVEQIINDLYLDHWPDVCEYEWSVVEAESDDHDYQARKRQMSWFAMSNRGDDNGTH